MKFEHGEHKKPMAVKAMPREAIMPGSILSESLPAEGESKA
jgi:hypothetical protein